MREIVHRQHRNDYGFVAITNERLVGCGPLLVKSSSKPLSAHNPSIQMGNVSGLIMIRQADGRASLVFLSQLGTSLLRGVTTYKNFRSCML